VKRHAPPPSPTCQKQRKGVVGRDGDDVDGGEKRDDGGAAAEADAVEGHLAACVFAPRHKHATVRRGMEDFWWGYGLVKEGGGSGWRSESRSDGREGGEGVLGVEAPRLMEPGVAVALRSDGARVEGGALEEDGATRMSARSFRNT
jgi:hypothetical protein